MIGENPESLASWIAESAVKITRYVRGQQIYLTSLTYGTRATKDEDRLIGILAASALPPRRDEVRTAALFLRCIKTDGGGGNTGRNCSRIVKSDT